MTVCGLPGWFVYIQSGPSPKDYKGKSRQTFGAYVGPDVWLSRMMAVP